MTFNEYQAYAARTSGCAPDRKILNGVMGLNGEAGECIDIVKKHIMQGHPLDREKLIDELSDVLWYCAELASGLEISLDEAAAHNVEKLKKRYPDGFETKRSLERP